MLSQVSVFMRRRIPGANSAAVTPKACPLNQWCQLKTQNISPPSLYLPQVYVLARKGGQEGEGLLLPSRLIHVFEPS